MTLQKTTPFGGEKVALLNSFTWHGPHDQKSDATFFLFIFLFTKVNPTESSAKMRKTREAWDTIAQLERVFRNY